MKPDFVSGFFFAKNRKSQIILRQHKGLTLNKVYHHSTPNQYHHRILNLTQLQLYTLRTVILSSAL